MKGISPLLNSYISNLQFLRSERSEEGFYSKIVCITKSKSPRNTWFAVYWRQNPTLEVLYSIFQIFTIGAKRGVFLSIKNHFYGYNLVLHDTMAASDNGESPIKESSFVNDFVFNRIHDTITRMPQTRAILIWRPSNRGANLVLWGLKIFIPFIFVKVA